MHWDGAVAAQIIARSPNNAGRNFLLILKWRNKHSVWLVLTVDVINSALLAGVCYFYQPWTCSSNSSGADLLFLPVPSVRYSSNYIYS